MSHLTVPLYCAGTTAFLLALLLRAIWTSAHSFTLLFLAALLFFAWRTYAEIRQNWPAFKSEMRRRTEDRRKAAQQKRYRHH
jgi:hypothetical protein